MTSSLGIGHSSSLPAKYTWVWTVVTVLALVAAVALLLNLAQVHYDASNTKSWRSFLASGLLNGAVVVLLGALVTALLAGVGELRARSARAMDRRLELFRRMRDAHVRVAIAQQRLRAQRDNASYREQMRGILQVIKDFEEVREEVKVSGRLFRKHRISIMTGIAEIIEFLEDGVSQFIDWSLTATKRSKPPNDGWLQELVDALERPRPKRKTSDPEWQPQGNMPRDYDVGLEKSKLILRAYVYGSRVGADKLDTT